MIMTRWGLPVTIQGGDVDAGMVDYSFAACERLEPRKDRPILELRANGANREIVAAIKAANARANRDMLFDEMEA